MCIFVENFYYLVCCLWKKKPDIFLNKPYFKIKSNFKLLLSLLILTF